LTPGRSLVELLSTELGVSAAVLVPQELPAGFLLTKIK
jgi:hypothetical protein